MTVVRAASATAAGFALMPVAVLLGRSLVTLNTGRITAQQWLSYTDRTTGPGRPGIGGWGLAECSEYRPLPTDSVWRRKILTTSDGSTFSNVCRTRELSRKLMNEWKSKSDDLEWTLSFINTYRPHINASDERKFVWSLPARRVA